jgi:hypothetical protein
MGKETVADRTATHLPPLQDATQQNLTGSMASGLPFYADRG